ncbi:alpha/beta hydrolase family protein [Bacillus niameyensis]|uniref:alpha/beta hydrolase family protein n=1 Tax=Bacillus niameyensis TaxID=1522308 RepID=UPI00078394EA|nr:dienelactone hydrolase family protein [Bacillus niameyensis]
MAYKLAQLQKEGIPSLLEGILTKDDWETKRKAIMADWLDVIGDLPECDSEKVEFLAIDEETDHVRIHLKYETVYEDWVTAYLLVPAGVISGKYLEVELFSTTPSKSQTPAVLALHPTEATGKGDIALESGRANRTYGLELVKRGFVVLAPDTITAGERIQRGEEAFHTGRFYEQYPEWSAVAKMLVDHRQGVSLLSKIPWVGNIGAIGHSLGGYNAYFLAGIDRRIKAVICSAGFATFTNDPERERWGKRDWFSHMPKVSEFLTDDEVPFEFHEIAGLAAPTPLFIWIGQNDRIFPHWKPALDAVNDLDRLYTILGEEASFKFYLGNVGHDFPCEIREWAYSFLDEHLQHHSFCK